MRSIVVRQRKALAGAWTSERVRHLNARWSQGASARQIARELGAGISRSAVLGKVHRLGISTHAPYRRKWKESEAPRFPRPLSHLEAVQGRRIPSWVAAAQPYVDDPTVDAAIPIGQRRSLAELTDTTCRWPVGDPATESFFFCGAPSIRDAPYCAEHQQRAYAPREANRR